MKKTIITLAFAIATLFGAGSLNAQNKFAYIDFQELMQSMPEYKKANTYMEAYGDTLQGIMVKMEEEYQKKINDYQKNPNMSEAIRNLKEKEIRDLQSRIQDFQETAQTDARKKQEELLKPIIEKAKNAIASVAKENGYTYVFDSSPGSNILYKPDGDNIMAAVKKKMGIQ
ncbi:MAG: OmpH family outer membrane protein [Bacteroidia bacterium]|jgi:outer membrane protein|nr:OmpH family outer membrane protein [Bacteroidia bacterium]